jgi:hypothetical protein
VALLALSRSLMSIRIGINEVSQVPKLSRLNHDLDDMMWTNLPDRSIRNIGGPALRVVWYFAAQVTDLYLCGKAGLDG